MSVPLLDRIEYKPLIIVLAGHPLSGKDALANELVGRTNFSHLDIDDPAISKLVDGYMGFDQDPPRHWADRSVSRMFPKYALVFGKAARLFDAGKPVVVTATVSHPVYQKGVIEDNVFDTYRRRLNLERPPGKIFELIAPIESLPERVRARNMENVSNSDVQTIEQAERLWRDFVHLSGKDVIKIDTGLPIEQNVTQVIDALALFRTLRSKEHDLPASILVEGPLDPTKVALRMTGAPIEYPQAAREYIEEQWLERLQTGRSTADSDAVIFRGISGTDGIDIIGAPSLFSIRNGTGQKLFREIFGDDLVARTIGVSVLMRTVDGYMVVGQRNTYRSGKNGGLHAIGGGIDGPEDLLGALNREVEEEVGIQPNEWQPRRLLGITQSKETLGIDVGYFGETVLTRQEVEARTPRTDKGFEELPRVFYSDTPNEARNMLLGFLRTASTSVITAIYFHGKQTYGDSWAEDVLNRIYKMNKAFNKYTPEQATRHTQILAGRLSGLSGVPARFVGSS